MRRLSAFISYRRNDSYLGGASDEPSLLQLIRTELIGLGFTDVFLDVSSLRVGETFDSRILREITECDLFIVLIGENWVKELKFRAENQLNDVAARELRAAMKMEKEIAAFLIDHAQMPSELELPQELIDFHYYDAARLASSADQAVISAALKPAAERVRGSWKLGSNWTLGYVVVSVLAYCLCAVVPNWVGLITYPDQWASFAGTWAGFFIWPALFLPFAVISLYYPITALIEAVVNARRLTNAITYAVPLIFGLVVAFMAVLLEVKSGDETPWTINPVFAAQQAPQCGGGPPYSASRLSRLVGYDSSGQLLKTLTADGAEAPFWLRDKCWPNVFFYLTAQVAWSPDELNERRLVQSQFAQAIQPNRLQQNHIGHSTVWPFYVISFSILIFLGATGVAMAVFFVFVRLRSPNDNVERLKPNEDGYLCLTYAFISLMFWVPFRMVTVYTKYLYNCNELFRCHLEFDKYLNDAVLAIVLFMGYMCITFGLLFSRP